MQRSIVVWLIALVGSLLIGAAVPTIAHAETCSPDGKICLVTETDPNHPLVPPATLEFRVASEATSFGVDTVACNKQLVQQGPPGGMSLWNIELCPAQSDGSEEVHARAVGSGLDSEATFQVQVLAPAVNYSVTITRTKKRVVATYQFDARIPIQATIQLWLDSFPGGETIILTHRGTTRITGLEHQVLKVTIPRKVITKRCKPYRHCSVLAAGQSWVAHYSCASGPGQPGGCEIGHTLYDRKRVK